MEKESIVNLVKSAQAGNSDAISELFAAYKNDVYTIAMRETKDRALSDDIVQETFVEVILKINDLKNPASFPAWLKIMAYHQCTRHYKKKETVHETPAIENDDGWSVFDTEEETNASFIPDEALDQKEFKATILELIDDLPDAQRAALHMFYFEEMPLKVIAKVQGVSVNTANTRLNRGRLAMKDSIEKYEKKHGIRLHSIAFFPFFKWLLKGSEEAMPAKSAAKVAQGISAEAGITINAANTAVAAGNAVMTSSAAGGAATVGAATTGIGTKIAAMPVVGKIVSGILAASIVVGLPAAIVSQTADENISIAETTSAYIETLSVSESDTPEHVNSDNPFATLGVQCFTVSSAFKVNVLNVEGDTYYDYNVHIVDRITIDTHERDEEEYDGGMYDIKNAESPSIELEQGYYYWMMVSHDHQTIDAVYFSVAVKDEADNDPNVILSIQTGFPVVHKLLRQVEVYSNNYRSAVYTLKYNTAGLVSSFKYVLSDSEYWWEDTYEYDRNGRVVLHRSDDADATFSYNYNGDRLASYTESYIGEADTQYFLEYDSGGKLIQKSSESLPGHVTYYEYGDNDWLTKQTTYTTDLIGESEWQNETLYVYDELGNRVLTNTRYLSYRLAEGSRDFIPYVEELLSTTVDVFNPQLFHYVPNNDVTTVLCLGKDSSGDSCCSIPVGKGSLITIEDGVVVRAESGEYRYELIYEDIQGEIVPSPLP